MQKIRLILWLAVAIALFVLGALTVVMLSERQGGLAQAGLSGGGMAPGAPTGPTPMGIFRAVERPTYEQLVDEQLTRAKERQGAGELGTLLQSGIVWEVEG